LLIRSRRCARWVVYFSTLPVAWAVQMTFRYYRVRTRRIMPQLPEGLERNSIPLATTRGRVDIAPILSLLGELPASHWHPEGQDSNVHLKRAGHDRWGVGKIVLIMCDDMTTKILHFPWWETFRPVVTPILEHLGVPEGRVIRCLLAAMPPGEHIPTHHDTGDWVPLCHRIHIPLVTNEAVVFSCGYTEENMCRIETTPGLGALCAVPPSLLLPSLLLPRSVGCADGKNRPLSDTLPPACAYIVHIMVRMALTGGGVT
jgi:hypothetical protein